MISRSEMTKKRWVLDAPGAFVSGISRSEMTKSDGCSMPRALLVDFTVNDQSDGADAPELLFTNMDIIL